MEVGGTQDRIGSPQRVCYQASYSCGQLGRSGSPLSCHHGARKLTFTFQLPLLLDPPGLPIAVPGQREARGELSCSFSLS